MFIDGHFYGCITLAQSVAEGILKFLSKKNGMNPKGDPPVLARKFSQKGVITADTEKAFKCIRGNDRNDLHHMNDTVCQDYRMLEARAEEVMSALLVVESDVFAHTTHEGMLVFKNAKYWPHDPHDGMGLVHVDFT